MKKKFIEGFILAILIFSVTEITHAGMLYSVQENTNSLVTIDTDTLAISTIGLLGVNFNFGGLAYDNTSQTLYMTDGRVENEPHRLENKLYKIDMATGHATLIGHHGVKDMFGLAFDTSTHTLYGSQFLGGTGVYSLDTSTGSATYIGDTGLERGLGGLAYNSRTDTLVGSQDGYGDLYSVDRTNGSATLLYNGARINDTGLAYDSENNLYWGIDWDGYLYSWDIDNGYERTTHLSGLGAHDGLAFVENFTLNPVPEPATMFLLGTGIVGLAGITMRKKK